MISLQAIWNLSEAKKILRDLRLYKDMVKKLWKRGRILFHRDMNHSHSYKIEYFPSLEKEYILEKAVSIYKQVFLVDVKKEDIILKEKINLLSWMKIYFDDACVDMSFKNIEYKLQK
jgi:hypothetical protein